MRQPDARLKQADCGAGVFYEGDLLSVLGENAFPEIATLVRIRILAAVNRDPTTSSYGATGDADDTDNWEDGTETERSDALPLSYPETGPMSRRTRRRRIRGRSSIPCPRLRKLEASFD